MFPLILIGAGVLIATLVMSSKSQADAPKTRYDSSNLKPLPPGIPQVPNIPQMKAGEQRKLTDYELKMSAWLKDKYKTQFVSYDTKGRVWYVHVLSPERRIAFASDGQTEIPYYDKD